MSGMYSWEQVQNHIIWNSGEIWSTSSAVHTKPVAVSEKNLIIQALNNLYTHSLLAAELISDYIADGGSIRIATSSDPRGSFAVRGPSSGTPYIAINIPASLSLYHFGKYGNVVKGSLEGAIIHELIHVINNVTDGDGIETNKSYNNSSYDLAGGVLPVEAKVLEQLGLEPRVSYAATANASEDFFDLINFDKSYTDNQAVDAIRVGDKLLDVDTLTLVDIIDHSTRDTRDLMLGFDGNDVLIAGPDNDFLYGGRGDDALKGDSGSDRLYGENGSDTLYGGSENDLLLGGVDNDILQGGSESDTLDGGTGNDILDGGEGDLDTIDHSLQPSGLVLGLTEIAIVPDLPLSGNTSTESDLFTGVELVIGTAFSDAISLAVLPSGSSLRTVSTGNGDDRILLTGGRQNSTPLNVLLGGGNDVFDGVNGNAIVKGGEDHDTYEFRSGDKGKYVIEDDDGDIVLDGVLIGKEKRAILSYQDEAVTLSATLRADGTGWNLGAYKLTLLDGDLHLMQGEQEIILRDFEWGDYGIRLERQAEASVPLYTNPNTLNTYRVVQGANISVVNAFAAEAPTGGEFLWNVTESAAQGAGIIVAAEDIEGTSGNDVVDVLPYSPNGSISISTGSGDDIVKSNVSLRHEQNVYAGDGSDNITTYGGLGAVYGGHGSDVFTLVRGYGSLNDTQVYGGDGRDTFKGTEAATIDGGAGIDTWWVVEATESYTYPDITVSATARPWGALNLDVTKGTLSVDGYSKNISFSNIENFYVFSWTFDDVIITEGGDDYIRPDQGNNFIKSGAGDDTIFSVGNDTAFGEDGDDIISDFSSWSSASGYLSTDREYHGGLGDDTLTSANGNDTLHGEEGNDWLSSRAGNDLLDGGAGHDVLSTIGGSGTFIGGTGDDTIRTGWDSTEGLFIFSTGDGKDEISLDHLASYKGKIEIDGIALEGVAQNVSPNHWILTVGSVEFNLHIGPTGVSITRGDVASDEIQVSVSFADPMDYSKTTDDIVAGVFGITLEHNHAPEGSPNRIFADGTPNRPYVIAATDLTAGFTDADGDRLSVVGLSALNGTVTDNHDGTYTLMPWTGYSGPVELRYYVTDGKEEYVQATNTVTFRVPPEPENHAPVANDDYVSVPSGLQSLVIPYNFILSNDTDSDGDTLYIVVLNGVSHGALSVTNEADGTVVNYKPAENFAGIDSFTYTIVDGFTSKRLVASATVHIAVEARDNGNGNDSLIGSLGDDELHGRLGNDTISGLDGDDRLYGDEGIDSIDGGNGDDRIFGGSERDFIAGGAGDNYLDGGDGLDYAMYMNESFAVAVDLVHHVATHYDATIGEVVGHDTIVNIEGVYGSMGNDTLQGSYGKDSLTGANGDDLILGGYGDDNLAGWNGNDSLYGGEGRDIVTGDAGNDSLSGGTGADWLIGGEDNDTLNGGERWDQLDGGNGDDLLDGGIDNDQMRGGAGNDTYVVDHVGDRVYENVDEGMDTVKASISYALSPNIENLILTGSADSSGTGSGLSNRIDGGAGSNTILGGLGNDSLYGWDGDDSLVGGNDHDRLSGGNGNDTLVGGHGQDQMGGGAGADDFVFSSVANNGHDHVVDFQHGLDRLIFNASDYGFMAGHALTGAQFTLGSFAVGASAQFVWDSIAQKLYWDADGNGAIAAFEIALISNGATVTKEDIYMVA